MPNYTVVVLRPDYNTGEYSSTALIMHTSAVNQANAGVNAQISARLVDTDEYGAPVNGRAEDYAVLCVFNGHVYDQSEIEIGSDLANSRRAQVSSLSCALC